NFGRDIMSDLIKAYDIIANSYDSKFNDNLFWRISDCVTLNVISNFLKQGVRILDAVCGTGIYGVSCLKEVWMVGVIVLWEEMIQQVKRNIIYDRDLAEKSQESEFYCADIRNLKFINDDTYDIVICEGDVVGYCLEEDTLALNELKRIMNDNGVLF